jgi:GH25 family lysozyme M1 (1,4-beta-N-acetylmuramidase)
MDIFKKQFWFNNFLHGENSREQNRAKHFEGLSFDKKTAVATLTLPDPSRRWGVDLSHWNMPPVNIRRMVENYGMSFAIFKGCDGSVNTRYYTEHVQSAQAEGIPFGMYVWLYPANKVSIDAQVNAWWARFSSDESFALFIDAEWTYYAGQPANPNATDLRSALDKWKAKSGQSAIIYTAAGYANTYLKGFDWSREELWVANYGVTNPLLPTGANTYIIHQFTSTLDGHLLDPNGNAELDGNYFIDEATFQRITKTNGGTTPPPPEPPTGGTTMSYYEGKTTTTAKIWDSIGGTNIDNIPSNTTVRGNAPSGGYALLTSPVYGYTKTQWLNNYHLVETTPPPVDPPPVEPPPTTDPQVVTIQVNDLDLVYDNGTVKKFKGTLTEQ